MVIYLSKVRNSFLTPVISIAGLYKTAQLWRRRANTRAQLNGLSDQQLKDVGLTREDVINEAKKAFWE